MNVVLVYPEIPQNTGNIARTCAATGAELHLVRPLGFSLDDKYMKRAGLDYWFMTKITVYDSLEQFFQTHAGASMHFASTKSREAIRRQSISRRTFWYLARRPGACRKICWKSLRQFACAFPCAPRP